MALGRCTYQESKYLGTVNPFNYIYKEEDAAGTEPEDRSNDIIENAVPAYWEDMTKAFQKTSFLENLGSTRNTEFKNIRSSEMHRIWLFQIL